MHKLLEMGEPSELDLLRRRVDELEAELEQARQDAKDAVRDARLQSATAMRATAKLRQMLQQPYNALRALFGELDAMGVESAEGASANQPIPSSVYDAWKQRLPPSCGRVIDALLVQPMGYIQLKGYCKMGASTLDQALAKLRANNLIEKDGSLNRLKRL